ncbi:MAG: hypothetical protein HY688_02805 [Chloroflexi bacterium]|nr:hypothetical protein [Chloroflexota bacterium]
MRRFALLLGLALAAGVLFEELQKVPGEPRWRGKALGFVPYDLRPPTLARFREAYWNPEDRRIFTGKVWGIGWAINLAAVAERLRSL